MGELATPFIPAGLKKLNWHLTAGVCVSSFPIHSCHSSAINTKLAITNTKQAPSFPGWNHLEHISVIVFIVIQEQLLKAMIIYRGEVVKPKLDYVP